MRGQSVWLNYIMYFAFAITTLTIVLSTVIPYLEAQKTKYYLNYCENLISFIKEKVNFMKSIRKGDFNLTIELPENTYINISNKKISCNVISKAKISYNSIYNFSVKRVGDLNIYSVYSSVDVKNNVEIRSGKHIITIRKNESGIFILYK